VMRPLTAWLPWLKSLSMLSLSLVPILSCSFYLVFWSSKLNFDLPSISLPYFSWISPSGYNTEVIISSTVILVTSFLLGSIMTLGSLTFFFRSGRGWFSMACVTMLEASDLIS
jgi:hypothetical protein